jgi:serine/threonine-protein kinase
MSGALLGTSPLHAARAGPSRRQDVDHRADIYSLGVTLYRCVTGRCPFEGSSHFAVMMAHVQQPPEPPSAFRPHLPPALERIMLQSLAKDRADRPQSCAEFRAALEGSLVDVTSSRVEHESDHPQVIVEDDGNEMLLIPAGAFQMGANRRVVLLDHSTWRATR